MKFVRPLQLAETTRIFNRFRCPFLKRPQRIPRSTTLLPKRRKNIVI